MSELKPCEYHCPTCGRLDPFNQTIEDALRAERDELRRMLDAVLALEEPVEKALRAEIAEQRMYAESYGKQVLALRAEIAELKADLDKAHEAWLDWEVGLRMMKEIFDGRQLPPIEESIRRDREREESP